jgi:hypothetical protein
VDSLLVEVAVGPDGMDDPGKFGWVRRIALESESAAVERAGWIRRKF